MVPSVRVTATRNAMPVHRVTSSPRGVPRSSMHIKSGEIVAVKVIDLEHATDEIEDVQRVSCAHNVVGALVPLTTCLSIAHDGAFPPAPPAVVSTGDIRHIPMFLPPAHALHRFVPRRKQAVVRACAHALVRLPNARCSPATPRLAPNDHALACAAGS